MRIPGYPMPWRVFRNMTLADLQAVYVYVTQVPRRTGAGDAPRQSVARYCTGNAQCDEAHGETCAVATSECVGSACMDSLACAACQTCATVCDAPAADSLCVTQGV